MVVEEVLLRKAFYDLEKWYRPFFDFLTENQETYPEYKGGVTIDGYLNYEPDVLILSYNPAHGKYRDWDKEGAHLVYTGERPFGFFEKSNARKKGSWWETDKPVEHPFLANIVDFLYQYVTELGIDSEYGTQKCPLWSWSDEYNFEKRIMIMNIYPIATESCIDLKRLLNKMRVNNVLPNMDTYSDEWSIRKSFIYKMHRFIEGFVKPKTILCLGSQTISDYTWGNYEKQAGGIFTSKTYPNIIGISRSGTWTNRAKEAAKLISEIVKQNNEQRRTL